jgi:hypothetical protein
MTNTQTFKLYGPSGDVIMTGSMSAIMERLPDSVARNDALSTMLDTAVKQVEAEEKLEEAKACAVQILTDGISRLTHRLDQFEKQRALSAKRAEAARKEAARRQVQRYMDELPDPDNPEPEELYSTDPAERQASMRDQDPEGIPPAKDPSGASLSSDDGDLEIKHAPAEEERYGPQDDEYPGDLPRELQKATPAPSGSYTDPKPDPEGGPGKRKQIAPPTAISLW